MRSIYDIQKSPLCALLVVVALSGCDRNRIDSTAVREFKALELSLNDLSKAPPQDRAIRLEQLAEITTETEAVKRIKQQCLRSYRAFDKSTTLFDTARTKTTAVEVAVSKAEAQQKEGNRLSAEQEQSLMALKRQADDALRAANTALGEAEKYSKLCHDSRVAFRVKLAQQ